MLSLHCRRPSQLLRGVDDRRVYFVNSYRATPSEANCDWTLATSSYGGGDFVAAVGRGNVYATQFHPEKSGGAGLDILRNFLGPLDAEVPEPGSRSSERSGPVVTCACSWLVPGPSHFDRCRAAHLSHCNEVSVVACSTAQAGDRQSSPSGWSLHWMCAATTAGTWS